MPVANTQQQHGAKQQAAHAPQRSLTSQQHLALHQLLAAAILLSWLLIHPACWHSPTACVYTALHCAFNLLSVVKARLFPPPPATKGRPGSMPLSLALASVHGPLALYLLPPLLFMHQGAAAPAAVLGAAVALGAAGMFLHFTATMELHYRPALLACTRRDARAAAPLAAGGPAGIHPPAPADERLNSKNHHMAAPAAAGAAAAYKDGVVQGAAQVLLASRDPMGGLPSAVWPSNTQHWGQMMANGALALLDAAALQSLWPLAVFAMFAGLDVVGIVIVTSKHS